MNGILMDAALFTIRVSPINYPRCRPGPRLTRWTCSNFLEGCAIIWKWGDGEGEIGRRGGISDEFLFFLSGATCTRSRPETTVATSSTSGWSTEFRREGASLWQFFSLSFLLGLCGFWRDECIRSLESSSFGKRLFALWGDNVSNLRIEESICKM